MPRITALLAACYAICASLAHADVPPPPKAEATVVVLAGTGLGSGFHIGNGIIVTAAHVVETQTLTMIEMSDGSKLAADVLMVDIRSDIAFLQAKGPANEKMETARLACRKSVLGEEVMARGNPGGVRFLSNWGRVSGEPRQMFDWLMVIPTDIRIAPGNSGGPMFDKTGAVIGVVVGYIELQGIMFSALATPSLSVCKARTYLGVS
jgi:S1-C subfamily serine protease